MSAWRMGGKRMVGNVVIEFFLVYAFCSRIVPSAWRVAQELEL
jgi:hypothetical protein